jgi:molybdate/tungstate transport system permease protein
MKLSTIFALLSSILVLFVILPVFSTFTTQFSDLNGLVQTFQDYDVWRTILFTAYAAFLSTLFAVLFGTPLAYTLARTEFPGKNVVSGVVDLPVIIPHVVAGIALLSVFGSKGMIGSISPVKFVDALPGIVVAMLFVSAPFYINTAREGFQSINPRFEQVARTLGATQFKVFFTVTIPLTWRHIAAGALMSWARAISEFGAIVIIAYYPMVASTLIYDRFLNSGLQASRPISILLILFSLSVFITIRVLLWNGRKNESS